jgi:CheY-like chemotaxis protein
MARPRYPHKVLIVADDEELRSVLSAYLVTRRFDVFAVRSGLEALLQLERERPGIVVLDLGMPRLNGIEALKRIRSFDPMIRVVVVIGSTDAGLQQEALKLSAASILTKPVRLSDLDDAIG